MTHPEALDSEIDYSEYEATLDPIPEPPVKVHYVDNDEMLAAYIAYQEKRKEHKEKGLPDPPVPRYLSECLIKICTHTAYKHNFINYSYRDDMILDGIEDCIAGINMFDVNRKYIFSYYTTVAFNAFRRRIKLEERQSRVKGKLICEADIETMVTQEHDNESFQTDLSSYMKEASEYVAAHEKHRKKALVEDDDENEEDQENILVFE